MRRSFSKGLVALGTALAVTAGMGAVPAQAAPTAHLVSKKWVGHQLMEVKIYSPSMKRVIKNQVMTPPGMGRAPVLYLMSGMWGGDGDQWAHPASGARKFFRNKNVYVVNPMGAASTYYTDWYREDKKLGYKPMWETYMTTELIPVINRVFNTTGRNAIGGYSMSAGTSLAMMANHPNLYKAAASYSGCPLSANPLMQLVIMNSMVFNTPGVNPLNAYAGLISPAVVHNSPALHLAALKGKPVFLSAGTGVPHMPPDDHPVKGGESWKSVVEAGVLVCTGLFDGMAKAAGVNVEFYKQQYGAHSFGQFGDALRKSWPMFARALRTR